MEVWIPSVSGKINKSSKSNGSRGNVRGPRPAGRGSQSPSCPGPPGPAVFQLPGYVPCLPERSSRAIRSSGFRSLSMYFSLRSHTHLTLSRSPPPPTCTPDSLDKASRGETFLTLPCPHNTWLLFCQALFSPICGYFLLSGAHKSFDKLYSFLCSQGRMLRHEEEPR